MGNVFIILWPRPQCTLNNKWQNMLKPWILMFLLPPYITSLPLDHIITTSQQFENKQDTVWFDDTGHFIDAGPYGIPDTYIQYPGFGKLMTTMQKPSKYQHRHEFQDGGRNHRNESFDALKA